MTCDHVLTRRADGACILCGPAGDLQPDLHDDDDLAVESMEAELCRVSFADFVSAAWPIVEPAQRLIPGWHLDAIAEHLEAFARGEIRRLILNQPPGTAKSILSSVMLPAWIWTWRPAWRGLFASYSDALARRDSLRTRNLVTSPWYVERFSGPAGWKIDEDRQDDFSNTRSGRRMATSVGGRATGFRGHAVIVDDPISATEAHSEAARAAAIRWYTEALPSRVDDVDRAGFLVVMQRLHEDDLTGHLLAADLDYEHLCLPSEYDPTRSTVTSLGVYDRRTEPGELLCPEIHSREFLVEQRKAMGSYAYAGQHLQTPAPEGGGLVPTAAWRFFREKGAPLRQPRPRGAWDGDAIELPELSEVVLSVDLGFKGAAHNDNSAFVVVGKRGADRFVLDLVAKPMEFTQQITALLDLRRKWPAAQKVLLEDSANAAALKSELGRHVAGLVLVPVKDSKDSRIRACTPQIESGNLFLRDGARWVDDLVHEAQMYPNGRRDDRLDSLAQALNLMQTPSGSERLLRAFGEGSPNAGIGVYPAHWFF